MLSAAPAAAQWAISPGQEHAPRVQSYAREFLSTFADDPELHAALVTSTKSHSRLNWDEQRALDRKFRDQRADNNHDDLFGSVVDNDISKWLKEKMAQAPNGAVTEILLIDGLGWNVATTGDVADFFQGDELQWQDILPAGPDAVTVSELEDDGAGNRTLAIISLPINDGTRNIGVATLGIDTSKLP
jgi:hypothetical protein